MDDPAKGVAKSNYGTTLGSAKKLDSKEPKADGEFIAYMDTPLSEQSSGSINPQKQSTSAKALNRWFAERQKNLGSPRLLDTPNTATILSGGPISLRGNITLVDEEGFTSYANELSLCRCGASNNKPHCDEKHLDVEFYDSARIQQASDARASTRPCKVTFRLVKNGPVKFSGLLQIKNKLGQECAKRNGALCRCGQSTNKPFCDGSHEKTGFKSGR